MSSFKRSFLLVFDCSFSLCLHVFTGYWIFIRRQTLCVFGGFVKMFCTMIYKRCLFNTQKMSIEEHATMKYFYNAGKKNQSSTLLQVPAQSRSFQRKHWPLAIDHWSLFLNTDICAIQTYINCTYWKRNIENKWHSSCN